MEKIKKIIVTFWVLISFWILLVNNYYLLNNTNLYRWWDVDISVQVELSMLILNIFLIVYVYKNYFKNSNSKFWNSRIVTILFWVLNTVNFLFLSGILSYILELIEFFNDFKGWN